MSSPTVRTADRLSALPNELLRRILIAADLDLKSAVRTSILSRRWRIVWKSSLTKLDFHIPSPISDEWKSFNQFVENLMSFHNREFASDFDFLSVSTDGKLFMGMFNILGRIFAHGVANRVRTFRLVVGLDRMVQPAPPSLTELCDSVENLDLSFRGDIYKPWGANFSALRTLRLYRCILRPAPRNLNETRQYDPFGCIPNLSSLEVIECEFRSIYPIKIWGDKLVHLTLVNCKVMKLEIFAPQLKSFTWKDTIEGVFGCPLRISDLDVPSLKCLDIDIYLDQEILPWEKEKEASMKIFLFVQRFHLVKHVKLHPGTIKVLTMVPGLLEREDSPFENVQCLEFHDSGGLISSRRVFNALVSYFFDDFIRGSALFERVIARLGTLYLYLSFE
ncbi:Putative F-box/FBD/LRR-repeat protein At4g13965 [Linum perenne]